MHNDQIGAATWRRITAFVIDLLIWAVFLVAASGMGIILMHEATISWSWDLLDAPRSNAALAASAFAMIYLLLYHVFCEYLLGQTVGMLLLNVEARAKKGLTFWQALGRNLFLVPLPILSLLWVIEPVYYAFNGQRLLERWTNTRTVETWSR